MWWALAGAHLGRASEAEDALATLLAEESDPALHALYGTHAFLCEVRRLRGDRLGALDHGRQAVELADERGSVFAQVEAAAFLGAAQLADVWYAPVAFHDNGGAVTTLATAHVAATVPNLLGMEYHFLDAAWVGDLARCDVPLFRDGAVPLTDAPGLGFELDEALCRRHLAPGEHWFG